MTVTGPLADLRRVAADAGGPEDVVADAEGRVLTGLADGRIVRLTLSREGGLDRYEVVARTGGRPLGLEPTADGALLVCDARRGLLRVDPDDGSVEVLADSVDGVPLRFCSNVTAASDGTVYFTVSSRLYALEDWAGDIMERSATGQLLRLRPGGEPEVLLDGLHFANGVALSADESFVAFAETGAYRVGRYWLTGPAAGRRDTLVDELPGFPDNMSRGPGGLFWIAVAGPREACIDLLHRATSPAFRRAAWNAVKRFPPQPRRTTGAVAVTAEGWIVHDLRRRRSPYRMITSVCERDQHLIMGSLVERGVAVCRLPGRLAGQDHSRSTEVS
ncbi:SMP-30/gluconolactonase/LRE family protein [Streptomyces sp. NPDC088725]|uniref:SMP-30/gluconolactonase/LRE family protein n=1 Tax=Streptomyces sp. NPDC088725 TaxID=3365873 RepID=UPI00382BBF7B